MKRFASIHVSVCVIAAWGFVPGALAADTCDEGYVPDPPEVLESVWGVRIKDFKGNDSARRIYMGVGSFPDEASRVEAVQGNRQRWQPGVRYRLTHTSRLQGDDVVQTLDVQMQTGADTWEPAVAGAFPMESRHARVQTSSAANGFKLEVSTRGQNEDAYELRVEDAVLVQGDLRYELGDLMGLCHGTTCTADTRYYFATGIDFEAPFRVEMEFEYDGFGGKGERSKIQFGPVYMEQTFCFVCEDQLGAAEADRDRARDELDRARSQWDAAILEVGQLRDRNMQLLSEIDDLQAEIARLQAQLTGLTDDLTSAQTLLAACESDLDTALSQTPPQCPQRPNDTEKSGRAVAGAASSCSCFAASNSRLGPIGGGLLLMGLLALRRRKSLQ